VIKIKFDERLLNGNFLRSLGQELRNLGFRPPITGEIVSYERDFLNLELLVLFRPSRRDLIWKEFIL